MEPYSDCPQGLVPSHGADIVPAPESETPRESPTVGVRGKGIRCIATAMPSKSVAADGVDSVAADGVDFVAADRTDTG